jgi:hypothetical protein
MKISHELPLSLLSYSEDWNDYDYLLPHLLDKHADYKQYFLESKEKGRFVIMDNGLFEGVTHTVTDLLEKINLIEPNIFIVPDAWNDSTTTVRNAKYWTQFKTPFKTKLMVVLQGTTVNEIEMLYRQCVDLGYTHFAINHSSIVYQSLCDSPIVIANQSVGRVILINHLLNEKLIKDHHYIHLLGASTPQEFTFYRDNLPNLINSVDTSNPIICGALGKMYSEIGMLEKPDNKIEEFMEQDLTPQLETIKFNIQAFRKFCRK